MLNLSHFAARPDDYSRNQILSSFMDAAGASRAKLLPCMKKTAFKRAVWRHWPHLINDFFISDYDTFVYDRASVSPHSFKARKLWLRDWMNFRLSRYLLADTASHLEYWQSLFGTTKAKTMVVPVLANRDIYRPVEPKNENQRPIILFFGTYIPLQGINVIVDAIHRLPQWWGRARFRFIGRGQTFPAFLHQLRNLGIEQQVEVIDQLIPETELAAEIAASTIVLGVFGGSTKARSVVPNKVYQGMACARCVVTADTPAVREFFSDKDLALVAPTADSLAAKLDALLGDYELTTAIARQGSASFNDLYQATRESFIRFVHEIEHT